MRSVFRFGAIAGSGAICAGLILITGIQVSVAQHGQHTQQHGEHSQHQQTTLPPAGHQAPAQHGQPAHTGHHTSGQHDAHAGRAQMTPSDRDALFFERRQNDRMNFTQADVDFMVMMIPHHAQALIMSRLAPQNNAGPAVQRLAARILAAQSDEIALMQQWLRDRSQAIPMVHFDGVYLHINMEEPAAGPHAHHTASAEANTTDTHAGHTDHAAAGHNSNTHSAHTGHSDHNSHATHIAASDHNSHATHIAASDHNSHATHTAASDQNSHAGHTMHDHSDMPGMLTQEQLYELAAARGREFDRLFLFYMIGHHEGAVIMVNELFASERGANDRESFRLASDIYSEQITEIDLMRLMLLEYQTPSH